MRFRKELTIHWPHWYVKIGGVSSLPCSQQTEHPMSRRLATGLQIRGMNSIDYSSWKYLYTEVRTAETGPQDGPADAGSSFANALAEIKANRTSRNGDDSHDSGTGSRRTERAARECTYTDFLKCQPLNFKGTEGLVGLTRWFKRIESVFHIRNCIVGNHIKFVTCTLLGSALTWWNSHVKAVKGTDVASYTQHFQELTLMCERMFPEESDQVEKRSVLWLNVKLKTKGSLRTLQGTIKTSSSLSKGIMWHEPILQGLRKRTRTKDLNLYALNATTIMMDSVLPSAPTTRGLAISPGTCGAQGHFKSNFLKLKNKNQGNQAGNGNAVARAYDVGIVGTNPNSNAVTGTFLLNNHYASILFDTGANRIFVSTAFSSLIDIIPTTLNHGYDVELADGVTSGLRPYHFTYPERRFADNKPESRCFPITRMKGAQTNIVKQTSSKEKDLRNACRGIEVDRAKIDVIAKFPYPTNVKGARKKLTIAPIIISPDGNVPFELMCDASDFAVGAILGQRIDGKFEPIYYASKTLNNAQEHYTTTKKELLAVVFSFDKFHPYLVLSKTIVYTDHSALKYLFSKQDVKPRLIRWVLLLQGFDIEIKDKRGAKNLAADYLSRLENPDLGTFMKEEITDEFPDEHLMVLKTELNNNEPWYAD
ncbi:reverse transcriptase domain-containing protein [Tanacetum coccineum]|uniref:Reverse transcriptase domain-containing protein n=1 Tax=Tanacetum coccineum TaxID=301880 RepID=A0ABQ4YEQ7_9ASTR